MFRRNFHNQKGEFSLPMAIVMLIAAGIAIKVTVDKLGSEANVSTQARQSEGAYDAIDAAVVRAEALLKPRQLVNPGPTGAANFVPGDITVQPAGSSVIDANSKFDFAGAPPSGADWKIKKAGGTYSLELAMPASGNTPAQTVDLRFVSAILKPSGISQDVLILRGFEVDATAAIRNKDGSIKTITRPKVVNVDACAMGGCGQITPPNYDPVKKVGVSCSLELSDGSGKLYNPRAKVNARIKIKGNARMVNVPRLAAELGGSPVDLPATVVFGGKPYTIPAAWKMYLSRHTGANGLPTVNARNDILLTDHKADEETTVNFSFVTPSPLTAVDSQAAVVYPVWATLQLQDGTWRRCGTSVNVKVRQVSQCQFYSVDAPAIDNSAPTLDLSTMEYENYAGTMQLKGYEVPGCQEGCSNYKTSSDCTLGASRSSKCFWFQGAGAPQGQCLYREFSQTIACDRSAATAGGTVIPASAPVQVIRQAATVLPKESNIKWRMNHSSAACSKMRVYITFYENNKQYFFKTNAGKFYPIPTEFVDPDDPLTSGDVAREFFASPQKSDIYDKDGKLVGVMPKIIGNVNCSKSDFKVSVAHSYFVPRGMYKIVGNYDSDKDSVSQCSATIWNGADPCRFTNLSANSQKVPMYGGSQAAPKLNSPGPLVQPRGMVETDVVAHSPTNVEPCHDKGRRCFYYPYGSGPMANRTLFVQVVNPKTNQCGLLGVNRLDQGCFLEGSKILMADGLWKAGESVKNGEYVWNPVTKMAAKVINTSYGPERPDLIRIKTGDHEIKVTGNHPMPTREGLKAAKDLVVGDDVKLLDGSYAQITELAAEASNGRYVWNVRLEGSGKEEEMHYVLVDGVVAGDLTLQERLETKLKVTQTNGN